MLNQNVKKYATYLNNLKIDFNFNEETLRFKLFHKLNKDFRTIINFENALKTKAKILTKVLIQKKSSLILKFKNQTQRNQKKLNKKNFVITRNEIAMLAQVKQTTILTINNQTINKTKIQLIRNNFVVNAHQKLKKNCQQNEKKKCYKCKKLNHIVRNCIKSIKNETIEIAIITRKQFKFKKQQKR